LSQLEIYVLGFLPRKWVRFDVTAIT